MAEKTCSHCVHVDVCENRFSWLDQEDNTKHISCHHFKDSAGIVELPCKVGDTVYEIQNNTEACHGCEHYSDFYGMDAMCSNGNEFVTYPEVSDVPICEKQHFEIIERIANLEWIILNRNHFGKTVFLTREEAEKLLPELRREDGR